MVMNFCNWLEDDIWVKIEQYEVFVDKCLKFDLVVVIVQCDKVLEQQKIYFDFVKNIKLLQEQKMMKMRMMINLGFEVYV